MIGVRTGTGRDEELQCSHGNLMASVYVMLDNAGQIGTWAEVSAV